MRIAVVLFSMFLLAEPARADWPQFMGPDRDGISPETGLARTWPESGPEVLWTVALGEGFGAPAVVGDEVYVLDREENQTDRLRCFDLASGEELWSYAYDAPGKYSFPGSRSVPTIEGRFVYTCGPYGHLYCFDRETHEPVWSHDLLEEFSGERPNWAVAQLPTIHGDLLIAAAQGGDAGVVAFDKRSGELRWKSRPLKGGSGYVSPTVTDLCGATQAVMISASGKAKRGDTPPPGEVVGIDISDGRTLWSYEGWQCKIPITSATPLGEDRLLITGGYDAGSVILEIGRDGDAFEVGEVTKTDAIGLQIHIPLQYEGVLYGNSNSNSRRDGMTCFTPEGEVLWQTKRDPNFERGGLLLADGLIYNLEGDKGILHLIEPSREGYKSIASVDLDLTQKAWAPLALSDGKLLVRDQEKMLCLDVAAK